MQIKLTNIDKLNPEQIQSEIDTYLNAYRPPSNTMPDILQPWEEHTHNGCIYYRTDDCIIIEYPDSEPIGLDYTEPVSEVIEIIEALQN